MSDSSASSTSLTTGVTGGSTSTAPGFIHSLPAFLQTIGSRASSEIMKSDPTSPYVSPLLCAFLARCITLEREDSGEFPVDGPSVVAAALAAGLPPPTLPLTAPLPSPPWLEQKLVNAVMQKVKLTDDPLLETIKMQVNFEAFYATELQKRRLEKFNHDAQNAQQLDKIVEIGTNISSNAQVANLYRAIFKLMLSNGCVDTSKTDRNVDREIAAALESVFPQAGLNAFNMMDAITKRTQITQLINIVLGIRLFNREIKKGGAGLEDVPGYSALEVEDLYDKLEKESTAVGDICYTYSDVLALEHAYPGTISASVLRLQNELINRRQYILLIHQLQHEVLESIDAIKENRERFYDEVEQLKTLVGLRTSVPKEQVYPKFQLLSLCWRAMQEEREKNKMRGALLIQLLHFRQSFLSNLLEEDIEQLKVKPLPAEIDVDAIPTEEFDEFVETMTEEKEALLKQAKEGGGEDGSQESKEEENNNGSASQASALLSFRPLRLVKDTTPAFMSLPLEYQGYCCHTLFHRGGLLLPGNPSLGIIRVLGRHYSFVDKNAMQDFCEDPEKYIEGVMHIAKKNPALIHLLCLQPYIQHSDITELFAMKNLLEEAAMGTAPSKVSVGSQTPSGYINTDIPDPNYHWNEWELRRKAIQMADLTKRVTHSTQTDLSHFRRDNSTQYTLQPLQSDGTMPGQGTQTGITKATNVSRTYQYHAGLRGKPETQMKVVKLVLPEVVEDDSNGDLRNMKIERTKVNASSSSSS